ncbi:hypothetical protein [Dorea sp. AM58-8]|uniref:hypothetical protein n=1 Tax=Dorea sp. AM58-8 TaxID=2292346 RepID=UPI001FA8C913|nr:hypothetical protein [Dorea sp. AM58-8]
MSVPIRSAVLKGDRWQCQWEFAKIVKALGVDANTLLGVSTEVNETKIWVSAFSSRVQELKENEQEILKHTMNALIESMEKNRLKISTDKSSQVLHTR